MDPEVGIKTLSQLFFSFSYKLFFFFFFEVNLKSISSKKFFFHFEMNKKLQSIFIFFYFSYKKINFWRITI